MHYNILYFSAKYLDKGKYVGYNYYIFLHIAIVVIRKHVSYENTLSPNKPIAEYSFLREK